MLGFALAPMFFFNGDVGVHDFLFFIFIYTDITPEIFMISLMSMILCYNNEHLQHSISTSIDIRENYYNTLIPNFNGNNGM